MSDIQHIQLQSFWQHVVSELNSDTLSPTAAKAIKSFIADFRQCNLPYHSIDSAILKWHELMTAADCYSPSTRSQYLRQLQRFYRDAARAALIHSTDIFRTLLSAPTTAEPTSDGATAKSALAILRSIALSTTLPPRQQAAADILLLGLLAGGLPPGEAAQLRRDAPGMDLPLARAIRQRHRESPQQLYAVPLDQWRRRPAAVAREVEALLQPLLAGQGYAGPLNDVAARAWVEAAAIGGYTDPQIRASVHHTPAAYAHLDFVEPAQLTEADRTAMAAAVATAVIDYTEQWHVITLRPIPAGAKGKQPRTGRERSAEQISKALAASQIATTFYPYEELVKRMGKKLQKYSRPYIAGFMFFKSSEPAIPAIQPLIKQWGSVMRGPDRQSPAYAVVPRTQMEQFQRTIGLFSPDAEVTVEEVEPLRPGDRIGIRGFEGTGIYEIEEIATPSSPTAPLRLKLLMRDPDTARTYALVITADPSSIYRI